MKVSNHNLLYLSGKRVKFVATPNNSGRKLLGGKPRYIILHYTAGGSAQSAVDVFKNPSHKASAHVVLGRDGSIVQMGKLNETLWHAGKSSWGGHIGLNNRSVGIEIANWGWLKGGAGNWRSWAGQPIPEERVVEACHKYDGVLRGWEQYNAAQVMACAQIVRAIARHYGIEPEHILGHDDISPGRKQDPGPAWDMTRFKKLVFETEEDVQPFRSSFQSHVQRGTHKFGAMLRRFAR